MEEVLRQAPTDIATEIIESIFNKNEGKVLPTLMELWNIEEKQKKPKTKWDEIRETCDAFDSEMENTIMSKLRAPKQAPLPPSISEENEHSE